MLGRKESRKEYLEEKVMNGKKERKKREKQQLFSFLSLHCVLWEGRKEVRKVDPIPITAHSSLTHSV